MSQNEDLTNDRSEVYSRPAAHFDGDGALVVRASAASGCRRALWYAATEWQPTNPPTDGFRPTRYYKETSGTF